MAKASAKCIFVAAGLGSRLGAYTLDCPKCMLPLNGKPIIATSVDRLRANGVDEVNIVVGYQKDKIQVADSHKFENTEYPDNNILFSLMYASSVFERAIDEKCDLVISYSDIIYSNEIVRKLMARTENVAVAVDLDWQKNYEGRTEHPTSEAEKVQLTDENAALKMGKNLADAPGLRVGEFIGLMKLTPTGAATWLSHFNRLNETLAPGDPFQGSKEFKKSYVTHFLQDLIDHGTEVTCSTFEGGWMEFDTPQDYEKLLANYTAGTPSIESA